MRTKLLLVLFLLLSLIVIAMPDASLARPLAVASSYGGTYGGWPTSWKAIPALNDPDDGLSNERLDFVGDASDPGAYYAGNSEYLFFRVRVDDGSATYFDDTVMILIDGNEDGSPDYAFMWDSKENDQNNHGLELGVPGDVGTKWENTRMDDKDGNNAKKFAPPDFGLTNGDGYIRILNGQSTANFGTTTFVDFAIKWSYLSANTTLRKGQTWRIQLGSINQANDHNWINYDVAGGKAPSDPLSFPATIGFTANAVQLGSLEASSHAAPLLSSALPGAAIIFIASLALIMLITGVHSNRPSSSGSSRSRND